MVNIMEKNIWSKDFAVAGEDHKFCYKLPGKPSKEQNIIRCKFVASAIGKQASCPEEAHISYKVILWVVIKKIPCDTIMDKSPFLPWT
jgi:hypothetical protein